LYGVLSYSVVRRTKEIGIRMALGAKQSSVAKLILREIAVASAVGLAIGLVLGRLLARPVESLLYEVKPGDLGSLAFPLALLLAAAALAAVRPAWRAARVEPAIALRNE
jgi:ABC-type antimicrobial peptide transport system permease subunit